MSKNTIKINGQELRYLLEHKTGLTLYEISEQAGFSKNFLSQACRKELASPIVQNVVKQYGIFPFEYMADKKEKEPEQMSIEDLERERKALEALDQTVDISKSTYNLLCILTSKAADEVNKAFDNLKKEWAEAVKNYNKEIKEIKESDQ